MTAKLATTSPPSSPTLLIASLTLRYGANLPAELASAMAKAGATSPTIRLRQGEKAAVVEALNTIADDKADAAKRQQLVSIFGTINQPACVPVLLKIVAASRNDGLKSTAL